MSGESFENTDLEIEQETGSLPEDVGTVLDEDENVIAGEALPEVPVESFYTNLATVLDEQTLSKIGSDLISDYEQDKRSRQEWVDSYVKGLDLLGFKYENRNEPFQGASGATHPVLAEAVTQFQALAYKELMPADGPVRTQIIGISNPAKEAQSQRVKDFMNFQLIDQMKEYESEFDQMLFHLPLAGSTF